MRRPVAPITRQAKRRVDAERCLRSWAKAIWTIKYFACVRHLRGRASAAGAEKGTPALRDEEDVYTNHIHADDLAL